MPCLSTIDRIRSGKTALGIELGSTRIKAVLIDHTHNVLATGAYTWENRLENGLWVYHLEDAISGLQESFSDLCRSVQRKYGIDLTCVGSIGISGMMHGYLPLDAAGGQLAPFLTWRNTNTAAAADSLTELFQFNIPLRWSVAHLYQAILDGAAHVEQITYLTTLAGYIHWRLSGRKVMGIGDASGMFPIDPARMDYDEPMLEQFDRHISSKNYPWKLRDILPQVLTAGQDAGSLTPDGAILLDPTGTLHPGIPMAPPEGDAGTGMVATNSVQIGTGNVSAGTSIFSMVVLQKNLSRLYRDIDIVTTPSGHPVAMVHCNNGTSELDSWVRMFSALLSRANADVPTGELYRLLFQESLAGDSDCDGVLLYNYVSGEPVTGLHDGRPLLTRRQDSELTLANFMRSQIYSVMAALSVGGQILTEEKVRIRRLTGHGGLFKTPGVAQRYLSAAMNAPVTVMNTAGEGGPYGMAVLAAYLTQGRGMSLEDYLEDLVFLDAASTTIEADPSEVEGFARFLTAYRKALPLEHRAVELV